MTFPLLDLAVPATVPLVLALGTSLCCWLATVGTFGVLHELLEHFWVIELHDLVHVLLDCLVIHCEKGLCLVVSYFFPVSFSHNPSSDFRNLLNYKGIGRRHWAVLHHWQFFQCPQHGGQHGQLVQQHFIQVLSKSEQILFSECSHLIFLVGVWAQEHVVDCEPDLSFYLSNSAVLINWNNDPFLVLKLLHFSLCILPDPGFQFQKRHKHTGDVIVLHHLVDHLHWQLRHVVWYESDQTQATHCTVELQLFHLPFQFFLLIYI